MRFDDLRQGEKIFIDANIFVYHFGEGSGECKHLLARCGREEIIGHTSTAILAEVLHRLMIVEAVKKGHIIQKNPVRRLKEHPEIIRKLSDYIDDVTKISQMNIKILTLTPKHIKISANIRQTEGLLTNDSLIVAVMKEAGLSKLATHDNDFDHIAWLQVYKPSDID